MMIVPLILAVLPMMLPLLAPLVLSPGRCSLLSALTVAVLHETQQAKRKRHFLVQPESRCRERCSAHCLVDMDRRIMRHKAAELAQDNNVTSVRDVPCWHQCPVHPGHARMYGSQACPPR